MGVWSPGHSSPLARLQSLTLPGADHGRRPPHSSPLLPRRQRPPRPSRLARGARDRAPRDVGAAAGGAARGAPAALLAPRGSPAASIRPLREQQEPASGPLLPPPPPASSSSPPAPPAPTSVRAAESPSPCLFLPLPLARLSR